ncbi:MAG: thermonuclease family protein [Candidatus Omnitrophica bacterium]|nr:thermonuclease family protein [Candidatus Omnitrophota bacterium]
MKGNYDALFLILFLISTPLSHAGGKLYYGTGEGAGVKVSIPLGEKNSFRVRHVVDGDTIELENGEKVRYIGIDAPEERKRVGEAWFYDPEPYATEATQENQALVEGKKVRLEFDRERRDPYGRLLAYVYVPIAFLGNASYDGEVMLESHEIFVNALLLQKGLARPLLVPPNVRYADRFKTLALKAQKEKRGLWEERKE